MTVNQGSSYRGASSKGLGRFIGSNLRNHFIIQAINRNRWISMIDTIYSVAVMVSDRKKAAQWYKEKLGFDIKEESGEHWTVVAPPNGTSVLHLCEGDLEPGNTGILLLPDDFDKTVQELKKTGVQFTGEPKKEPWGTYAMIKDADGNEFWLMPKE